MSLTLQPGIAGPDRLLEENQLYDWEPGLKKVLRRRPAPATNKGKN